MSAWDNFFIAQVGASAALAGLLFVGVSINISRLLQQPGLLDRALQALTLLITILVIASLDLVPVSTNFELGIEILVAGGAALVILTALSRQVYKHTESRHGGFAQSSTALIESASALYLAAGAALLIFGWVGIDLVVAAILLSYVISIIIAWVLLVEVNRLPPPPSGPR